jgi:hypothetical protein
LILDDEWARPQKQDASPDSLGLLLRYTGHCIAVVRHSLVTFRVILCSVSGLDELELTRTLHRVGTLQPGPVVDCGLSGSIRRPCWNSIRSLLQATPVQL